MILTYSKDIFVEAIKNGSKVHTIREDPNRRWKPGMSIQHWRGNPRNKHQNPYCFGDGWCLGVQEIDIRRWLRPFNTIEDGFSVYIDGRFLYTEEVRQLVINDELSIEEFRDWFVPDGSPSYVGRIIHFTELKY